MTQDDKLQAHIDALEQAGYVIKKKRAKTKTHTFVVDMDLLAQFKAIAKQRNKTIRQAIKEAITCWINKSK